MPSLCSSHQCPDVTTGNVFKDVCIAGFVVVLQSLSDPSQSVPGPVEPTRWSLQIPLLIRPSNEHIKTIAKGIQNEIRAALAAA